jgi:hypothetical protein
MKTCGEVEVQFHHSWPRHYMEVSGQLRAPTALPPRRLGGPQSRSAHCEEKNIPFPCRKSKPGRSACSPSPYRLSYPIFVEYMVIVKASFDVGVVWVTALICTSLRCRFLCCILKALRQSILHAEVPGSVEALPAWCSYFPFPLSLSLALPCPLMRFGYGLFSFASCWLVYVFVRIRWV